MRVPAVRGLASSGSVITDTLGPYEVFARSPGFFVYTVSAGPAAMLSGGVTSGVFGALRLVQQLAGAAEAQRVGRELAYPGWSLDGPTGIPAHRPAPRDLINLLAGRATARVTAKSIEYQDHGGVAGTVTRCGWRVPASTAGAATARPPAQITIHAASVGQPKPRTPSAGVGPSGKPCG